VTDRKPVRVSEAATQERLASLEQELAQAQEALKTQGAELSLLKAIVDNSTAVVYVKNAAGRYLMVNRQFEKVFGVAPGSMPGKTDFDVFAADDANRFRKVDEQVIATGRRIQAEEFVSLADRVHTFTSVKSPLLDADGVPYAVCGIATDISDRKQAEDVVHSQLGSMELLRRLTRAIAERQDLGSIFGTVLSTLEDRLPLDFAAIAQFDTVSQTLDLTRLGTRTQQSGAGELSEGIVLSTDSRCIARANRGELSYEPDIGSLSGRLMHQLKNAGISAVVAAPLLAESSVFGVLLVGRTRSHSFVESECDFLLQLGEHLALAIHQAQLYAVLQQAYDDLRKSHWARWRAASLTISTTRFRPWRCTPSRCSITRLSTTTSARRC
jgi:PAS domain S-box-containing protein